MEPWRPRARGFTTDWWLALVAGVALQLIFTLALLVGFVVTTPCSDVAVATDRVMIYGCIVWSVMCAMYAFFSKDRCDAWKSAATPAVWQPYLLLVTGWGALLLAALVANCRRRRDEDSDPESVAQNKVKAV